MIDIEDLTAEIEQYETKYTELRNEQETLISENNLQRQRIGSMKMMMSQDGGAEMSRISYIHQSENQTAVVVKEDSSESSDQRNNSDDFAEQFKGYQDQSSPEVLKEDTMINELNDFENLQVNEYN